MTFKEEVISIEEVATVTMLTGVLPFLLFRQIKTHLPMSAIRAGYCRQPSSDFWSFTV